MIGLTASAVSLLFVLVMGWLSYRDKFFSVKQMTDRGIPAGLPFAVHHGMWGDLFIITPLVGLIINSHQWSVTQMVSALLFGIIVSAVMHKSYTLAAKHEALTENGKLTAAGQVHAVYMALALGVFSLFYIYTPAPSHSLLVLTSVLLAIHIVIGTQVVFSFTKPKWFPSDPLKNPATWLVVGSVWVFLIWRTLLLLGLL